MIRGCRPPDGHRSDVILRCFAPDSAWLPRPSLCLRDRARAQVSLMASPPLSTPAGATPAMRQFFDAKRQYRDAILFFRMGDFYEMFYEDALTAARALELTLTSRAKDASGGAI